MEKGKSYVWDGKGFALIMTQSDESLPTSFGSHRDLEEQEAG